MRCLRALDFLPEILVQIAIRKQIKKNDGTYLTYRWMGTARELLFTCYNLSMTKQAEKARLLKRAQQVDQASGRTPGRITLATLKRQLQDPDGDAKLAAWMERSDERSRTTQQHLSDVPRNQQPIVLTDYWCERHQRVH